MIKSAARAEQKEYLERYRIESQPDTTKLSRELREILTCIHQSLFESELTVKKVKAECRIRNNNISTQFRHVIGQGIKEYIEGHRMTAACRILRRPGTVIFDVAMGVGYKHVETFYQVFHRHFDCTPGEYSQRERESRPLLETFDV
jgi:AraC-like DNA-binding protein